VISLVLWVMMLRLDPEALQQILNEQLRQLEQAGRS